MNTFAEIVALDELNTGAVRYYSIRIEDEEETLTEQFFERYVDDEELMESLQTILLSLNNLGKWGARQHYFRHEGKVDGLPLKSKFLEVGTKRALRLYATRLSDRVVFLFDGAEKTAKTYQDCPNVRPKHNKAFRLTTRINELMRDGEIHWDESGNDISYPDTIQLD